MKYPHILKAFYETPWALMPSKLAVIRDLIDFKAGGGQLSREEIQLAMAGARQPEPASGAAVAIIPVFGVLNQRMDMLAEMSGGTSYERIAGQFQQALADPEVGAIILDIDSPGGGVYGAAELAELVFAARGQKRIVAVADSLAASAAYWIGTAAGEFIITPSGEVGSIGVWTAHEDWSAFLEEAGIKVTLISAGKGKVEGNAYEPLSAEALEKIQADVDRYNEMFVKAVAKHRGLKAAEVRGFGGGYPGRIYGAREAQGMNMVDRVASRRQVITELAAGRKRASKAALRSRRFELERLSMGLTGGAAAK
jgi:signal peptide peptidase SppA